MNARTHWFRTCIFVVPIVLTLPPAAGQSHAAGQSGLSVNGQTATLSVDDPRPLATVADILEVKYGLLINYEDPAYSYEGDFRDVTAEVATPEFRQANPSKRVLVPRGGSVEVNFPVSPQTRQPADPFAVLRSALDQHNQKGNPGIFNIRKSAEVMNIVPDQVKNRYGAQEPIVPVLDAAISFSERERTGLEIVQTICDEISLATGQTVGVGIVPTNYLWGQKAKLTANGESARSVLLRAFKGLEPIQPISGSPPPKLAWRLFYDPGTQKYVLNLHIAMVEVPTPFGPMTLVRQ